MAVLVDDTNWADANWIAYNPALVVPVGGSEGWHQIWVGLRGLPANAQQTWVWTRVKLDLTPPLLVITNPAPPNVMQPMIEVQGYCPEAAGQPELRFEQRGRLLPQSAGLCAQPVLFDQHLGIHHQHFPGL